MKWIWIKTEDDYPKKRMNYHTKVVGYSGSEYNSATVFDTGKVYAGKNWDTNDTVIAWLDESETAALPAPLKYNAFMNGGNTDTEKAFYKMGYEDGAAALPANGVDWKTALREMKDKNQFDDKFNTGTLEFTYAFQMGYKAAPVNVGYTKEDINKAITFGCRQGQLYGQVYPPNAEEFISSLHVPVDVGVPPTT